MEPSASSQMLHGSRVCLPESASPRIARICMYVICRDLQRLLAILLAVVH